MYLLVFTGCNKDPITLVSSNEDLEELEKQLKDMSPSSALKRIGIFDEDSENANKDTDIYFEKLTNELTEKYLKDSKYYDEDELNNISEYIYNLDEDHRTYKDGHVCTNDCYLLYMSGDDYNAIDCMRRIERIYTIESDAYCKKFKIVHGMNPVHKTCGIKAKIVYSDPDKIGEILGKITGNMW